MAAGPSRHVSIPNLAIVDQPTMVRQETDYVEDESDETTSDEEEVWLNLPVGRMTFQSFDVRVRRWSSRSGLVFLGSCKMTCRQVYMR